MVHGDRPDDDVGIHGFGVGVDGDEAGSVLGGADVNLVVVDAVLCVRGIADASMAWDSWVYVSMGAESSGLWGRFAVVALDELGPDDT